MKKVYFLNIENQIVIFCLGLHRKILVIELVVHPIRTNLVRLRNSVKDRL